jgi:hypothetical protein
MPTNTEDDEFSQQFRPNDATKAPRLKAVDGKILDPFDDLAGLMCDQSFNETGGAKRLLTRVPVRRPRVTDWFMVHPDPAYRGNFRLCENKEESETFLVLPPVAAVLDGEPTLRLYTIFTAINKQRTIFLFPVRLQERDGKWNSWHRSQYDAAERARQTWLRMISYKDIGGYDLLEAPGNFAKPDWSDLPSFAELLRIAFRDFLIDDVDHIYLKRLCGEVLMLAALPFRELWTVDFEFTAHLGERPEPICLVARELRSGQIVRRWRDEFGRLPPYGTGAENLFIAFYASAELGCHRALDWPMPAHVLDLCVEFKNLTSGLSVPAGRDLIGALILHGLDHIGAAEKVAMQELAIRGGPWTAQERANLLDYCQSDVEALDRLFHAMLPRINLPRALLRGRYMGAAAAMEWQASLLIFRP